MYAVRSAALLMAVVEIDNDAMLEIIEQTEGARVLGKDDIRISLLPLLLPLLIAFTHSDFPHLFHSHSIFVMFSKASR